MADAIARALGEEGHLIDVGRRRAATEVLAEGPRSHEHDTARLGVFLRGGASARRPTNVAPNRDEAALVQRAEIDRRLGGTRHPFIVWDGGGRSKIGVRGLLTAKFWPAFDARFDFATNKEPC